MFVSSWENLHDTPKLHGVWRIQIHDAVHAGARTWLVRCTREASARVLTENTTRLWSKSRHNVCILVGNLHDTPN